MTDSDVSDGSDGDENTLDKLSVIFMVKLLSASTSRDFVTSLGVGGFLTLSLLKIVIALIDAAL